MQGYNLVGITETWWDGYHDRRVAIEEGQEGKMRSRSHPLCEQTAGVHGILPRVEEELRAYGLGLRRGTDKSDIMSIYVATYLARLIYLLQAT